MQTFRPAEVDLESVAKAAGGFESARSPEAPVTRSAVKVESPEGGLRSGVWEATSGRRDFVFTVDEWAYILEGEAHVTASGRTHVLQAGDVFYAPAGERMSWVVPTYVRKVWVHRRPPLMGRIKRKVRKLLAMHSVIVSAAAATPVIEAIALV
jgi:uncharacterized cupin superfamily protein